MAYKLDSGLVAEPLTLERWNDFQQLFGPRGACGGCWCMWWKLRRSEFEQNKGAGNKRAMKRIVSSGRTPGLLLYGQGRPIGWCAVEPRQAYSALSRSRILKPVDDRPVWSIVCFFIEKDWRRAGLSVALLRAAVLYARDQGAEILEGYPVEPKKESMPAVFAYTGLASAFRVVGFREVARRSETRPIMRLEL